MSESPSVDFHVHYTDSTAKSILQKARDSHIVAVGFIGRAEISDKIQEHVRVGEELGVKVFSGVECLSRVGKDIFVDLIAIGVDNDHPSIKRFFGAKEGEALNSSIAKKQYDFLLAEGYNFDNLLGEQELLLEELLAGKITEKAIRFCQLIAQTPGNSAGVVHLQREFPDEWQEIESNYSTKPGYVGKPSHVVAKFLYSHYFTPGKAGHVSVQPLAREFIEASHAAGGVILYSPEGKYEASIWNDLQEMGIDGIMGWHAGHLEIEADVAAMAHKNGLLVLGGSDYNPERNHWQLGNGKGDMYISTRRLADLELRLKLVRQK